jgi:L-ribulose-5-phosphate 4-epimerase
MVEQEGVLKFQLNHEITALEQFGISELNIRELNIWRRKLVDLGLIGATPDRYEGYGFGNLSCRTASGFLITGSQTGHILELGLEDFAEVIKADAALNSINSRGKTKPSSESLTHASVYEARAEIQAVFHVHSPIIWRQTHPSTAASIPYGTPEMALAVADLVLSDRGLFTMLGHEDGVVSYGTECDAAGLLLLDALEA